MFLIISQKVYGCVFNLLIFNIFYSYFVFE